MLNLMFNQIKNKYSFDNINIFDNNIVININNNIIKINYDNEYHLFLKTNMLDTELITNDDRILEDVLHLINLYK